MTDLPLDNDEFEGGRTSRQVFRQAFSGFGEAITALPLLLFSPILWLFEEVPSFGLLLVISLVLLLFKSWVLMLIFGLLHSWGFLPVSLSYVRSLLLMAMLYLLVLGLNFKSSD